MDIAQGRIIVMLPDAVAAAAVVDCTSAPHDDEGGKTMIAGHDTLLFVARGEGTFSSMGHTGVLRPNTLIAAPAGAFSCELSDDREMYIVSVRDAAVTPDDQRAFTPFFIRELSAADGRVWHQRMAEFAARAESGRFDAADVTRLKNAALPYVWQRDSNKAQRTLHALFESIWSQLATPLTLDRLAADTGYTANYLNDLTRVHTGRAVGGWITEMRMARARVALEQTDTPIAEVGVACGYDDPAYFSRVFRRAHGVPPQTWRIGARPVDARHTSVTISLETLHELALLHTSAQRTYSFAS